MADDDRTDLRRGVACEAAAVVALTAGVVAASVAWNLPGLFVSWSAAGWPVDHVVLVLGVSHLFMMVFGARRGAQLKREHDARRAAETEAAHRAQHDQLTGLPSRTAFSAALEDALAAAGDGPTPVVALLDLDRFGDVNATLGYQTGNALLQVVAERLRSAVPAGAALARLGGDEFGVLLTGVDADQAGLLAEGLLACVCRPVELDDLELDVEAAMGVSAGTAHDAQEVLRRADVAFSAARSGRSGIARWSPGIDTFDADRLRLHGELRRACRTGELRVHYQPQVELRSGRVVAVEALLRWEHPRRGLLLPGAFIDLAEQTGLVRELTDVVLRQALADSTRWRAAGLSLRVAVNLSARSLTDPDLPSRVAVLLAEAGRSPRDLELELTETAAMEDPVRAGEVLGRLRALGVGLAVDDFGTGHASLAYLARLPVHTLKIDRSFVLTMHDQTGSRTIVRSIIDLAHGLGLRVVAEGVETADAWLDLVAHGCDDAQGFWMSPAVPAEDLTRVVADLEQRLGVTASPDRAGAPAH
ncbi:putative bifunctional diguanylate cyclase/phosphodiesterase [Modestobacter lapidis]|nr:bifunctional diguanylate cyclase/phosphodiesterase [Modestobacter lapidis]